jgi:hypothetical protein
MHLNASAGTELAELLTPTIGPQWAGGRPRPWAMSSQFWVAFLGGILAVTAVAWLNAGRLNVNPRRRRWIAIIGTAALVANLAFWLRRPPSGDGFLRWAGGAKDIRLYSRFLGVLVYLAYARLQRREDRAYAYLASQPYESLWKVGMAAALALGALQGVGLPLIAWLMK